MRVLATAAMLCLSACSAPGVPVRVSQAIANLSRDLQGAGALGMAGSSTWTNAQVTRFRATVLRDQCSAGEADPVVPLLDDAVDVKLTGTITSSGSFSITASDMAAITPALTFGRSSGSSQELDLPVRFVALSAVPDTLLSRRAAGLANMPTEIKRDLAASAVAQAEAARALVQSTIETFDPAVCSGRRVEAAPLMMTRRPPR